MLPLEFILTDVHFAIGLLAAMACFATLWLYLDAWIGERAVKDLFKWAGYGLLAVGFVLSATEVEQSFLGDTLFGQVGVVGVVIRLLGYVVLAIGVGMDPLQPIPVIKQDIEEEVEAVAVTPPRPAEVTPSPVASTVPAAVPGVVRGAVPVAPAVPVATVAAVPGAAVPGMAGTAGVSGQASKPAVVAPKLASGSTTGAVVSSTEPIPTVARPVASPPAKAVGMAMVGGLTRVFLPVVAGVVAFLYWRRATTGLERHLKPVGWAFVWITAYEVVGLASLWQGTTDPRLYAIVKPFGPLWLVDHAVLAVAAVFLGGWVWQYLTKRVQTQLFMVLTTGSLAIFLVTTISFTFLLMSRVQTQAFGLLNTTAKVLGNSIDSQQAKATADAEVVAQNPAVAAAIGAKDHARLAALMKDFLTTKKQSSLVVTTDSALVLLRAEDPANWGDSISSDTLVARAAVGKTSSGLVASEGALAPRLIMKATTPVRDASGLVVGTVTVGFTIDNAFVDGLEQSTGLTSTIYSGSTRVATTLLAPDGRSRSVGVKETRTDITKTVLTNNKIWSGLATAGGRSYLAVYAPLRDADNAPVGMLFIGQPQVLLLQAAGRSIELTFLVSVVLLVIAIWPIHLVSRSLARQLR